MSILMRLKCPSCSAENQFRPINLDNGFIVACKNCGEELELALQKLNKVEDTEVEGGTKEIIEAKTLETASDKGEEAFAPSSFAKPAFASPQKEDPENIAEAKITENQQKEIASPHEDIASPNEKLSAIDHNDSPSTTDSDENPSAGENKSEETPSSLEQTYNSEIFSPPQQDELVENLTKLQENPKSPSENMDFLSSVRSKHLEENQPKKKIKTKAKQKSENESRKGFLWVALVACIISLAALNPTLVASKLPITEPLLAKIGLISSKNDTITLENIDVDTSNISNGEILVRGDIANQSNQAKMTPEIEILFHAEDGSVSNKFKTTDNEFIAPAEIISFSRSIEMPTGDFSNVSVKLAETSDNHSE